jgi:hypothetical protein
MNLEHLKSRLESQVLGPGGAPARPAASSAVRRIVWAFALFSLLVWSLLAWGAHVVLSGGADFLQNNLHWFEAYAWLEPWLAGGVGITEGVAIALTWIVWALGAIAILMGAWLLPKAFRLFGSSIAR